jgi:hypothetical protein
MFPNVKFREAWIYRQNCNCKPFGKIPEYYLHRLKIGKEGPGIVIKLGMNSCYGKLAQSVGSPKFSSWIWAGMITSGTRAQLLQMLALHNEPQNLLMMATDGILTREKLSPPKPLFTATAVVINGKIKPLGGWEYKPAEKGMFIARPGIYFPLNPTEEELAQVRARGIGRASVLECWQDIVAKWEEIKKKAPDFSHDDWKRPDSIIEISEIDRFCGAKTSISKSAAGYRRASNDEKQVRMFDDSYYREKPSYGQWIKRPIEMSFDPMPKREKVNRDGITLKIRQFPIDLESAPYDRAVASQSPEAVIMRASQQEIQEQPD